VAGRSSIAGARTDLHGNAAGEAYDLGLKGAFKGIEIGVLHLYTGEGFNFKLPQASSYRILLLHELVHLTNERVLIRVSVQR
jgi:hypothetical protein